MDVAIRNAGSINGAYIAFSLIGILLASAFMIILIVGAKKGFDKYERIQRETFSTNEIVSIKSPSNFDNILKDAIKQSKNNTRYDKTLEIPILSKNTGVTHNADMKIVHNPESKNVFHPLHEDLQYYMNNFIGQDKMYDGLKTIIIGPNQVGKTHICQQYANSLKGITVYINIDATMIKGRNTDELSSFVEKQIENIKKINKNRQSINFVLHIDEFDNKEDQGFELNIPRFKRDIFDKIIDNKGLPEQHNIIPHLIITANNPDKFKKTNTDNGVTNDTQTFLNRIPQIFTIKKAKKAELKNVIGKIKDNDQKYRNINDDRINNIFDALQEKAKSEATIAVENQIAEATNNIYNTERRLEEKIGLFNELNNEHDSRPYHQRRKDRLESEIENLKEELDEERYKLNDLKRRKDLNITQLTDQRQFSLREIVDEMDVEKRKNVDIKNVEQISSDEIEQQV